MKIMMAVKMLKMLLVYAFVDCTVLVHSLPNSTHQRFGNLHYVLNKMLLSMDTIFGSRYRYVAYSRYRPNRSYSEHEMVMFVAVDSMNNEASSQMTK